MRKLCDHFFIHFFLMDNENEPSLMGKLLSLFMIIRNKRKDIIHLAISFDHNAFENSISKYIAEPIWTFFVGIQTKSM